VIFLTIRTVVTNYEYLVLLYISCTNYSTISIVVTVTQWAGSFEELLLDAPRSDTPMHLPLAPADGATWVPHPADSWPWAPHSGTGSDPPMLQANSSSTDASGNSSGATFIVTHFEDGTPRPHHCPSQGLVCPGVLAVTPKQRKHIQLYSRLTTAPEPDIETMVRPAIFYTRILSRSSSLAARALAVVCCSKRFFSR
jgi:hypothetical protein